MNNINQINTMSIDEFCGLHDACDEGRAWALANCTSMQHAWDTIKPEWLLWIATRKGVLTDRELRKFAVWSARQVQHLMTDPRSAAALDVAERHADGLATDEELRAAAVAARVAADAAWVAAGAAASWAAADAAWVAARAARGAADAAWVAARVAADAVWVAAAEAASWAAADAARAAADAAQATWLRENTKPNFGKTK